MAVFYSRHKNLIACCVSSNTTGEKSSTNARSHHPAHLLIRVALAAVLERARLRLEPLCPRAPKPELNRFVTFCRQADYFLFSHV